MAKHVLKHLTVAYKTILSVVVESFRCKEWCSISIPNFNLEYKSHTAFSSKHLIFMFYDIIKGLIKRWNARTGAFWTSPFMSIVCQFRVIYQEGLSTGWVWLEKLKTVPLIIWKKNRPSLSTTSIMDRQLISVIKTIICVFVAFKNKKWIKMPKWTILQYISFLW